MKRLAVGKKWVDTIGQADAWSLKARRRAGEIVEQTPTDDMGGNILGKKGFQHGARKAPRATVRKELGISEHESTSWQALARIPEPFFEAGIINLSVQKRRFV